MKLPDDIKFDKNGLIPAVIQSAIDSKVLMLGFMNQESLERTITEGKVCFWSRSRNKFWLKGETSGNFLLVKDIRVNCYVDSLLIIAEPVGPTCHNGYESCYYRKIIDDGSLEIIEEQLFDPTEVYNK